MPVNLATPEPLALRWARTSAGFEPEAVANKLHVPSDRIRLWEEGKDLPTFTQLRNLAKVYKRPTAVFYLKELPIESQLPTDFRSKGEASSKEGSYSTELIHELRRARDRRAWTLELMTELGRSIPIFNLTISLDTPPEQAATMLRQSLGVNMATQRSWKDEYTAFGAWRAKIEKAGVLCFQAKKLPIADCRGFSITDSPLPAIVTNIKDTVRGRIFTLLHELTHVVLRRDGLCNLRDDVNVEWYCNQVAGAVIFPRAEFLASDPVVDHPRGAVAWSDNELLKLSRTFGGSREAALVRLLNFGLTSPEFYKNKRADLLLLYKKVKANDTSFVPPHTIELSCAGGLFTSTVLESLERKNITTADASEYLHIGFKHLPDADKVAAKYEGGYEE